jgi:hypothetical protein
LANFSISLEAKKTASRNGTDIRAKAVPEILSDNPQLTGEDIANQCHFESRTAAAGTIAKLVRAKAIEQIPASYRITDSGRNILETPTKKQTEEPKKGKRKPKREPQDEPSSGQGEHPSP